MNKKVTICPFCLISLREFVLPKDIYRNEKLYIETKHTNIYICPICKDEFPLGALKEYWEKHNYKY